MESDEKKRVVEGEEEMATVREEKRRLTGWRAETCVQGRRRLGVGWAAASLGFALAGWGVKGQQKEKMDRAAPQGPSPRRSASVLQGAGMTSSRGLGNANLYTGALSDCRKQPAMKENDAVASSGQKKGAKANSF